MNKMYYKKYMNGKEELTFCFDFSNKRKKIIHFSAQCHYNKVNKPIVFKIVCLLLLVKFQSNTARMTDLLKLSFLNHSHSFLLKKVILQMWLNIPQPLAIKTLSDII